MKIYYIKLEKFKTYIQYDSLQDFENPKKFKIESPFYKIFFLIQMITENNFLEIINISKKGKCDTLPIHYISVEIEKFKKWGSYLA